MICSFPVIQGKRDHSPTRLGIYIPSCTAASLNMIQFVKERQRLLKDKQTNRQTLMAKEMDGNPVGAKNGRHGIVNLMAL